MEQEHLESLLAWLDPERRPVLVQLPAAHYARLKGKWNLPYLSSAATLASPEKR
jgi:hypothetical protein